jgi:signal transduction histidine kinase
VHGSELAIHTAITNLIANALRHASGTPTLTIHVADGGHVSVIDNGPGIQADEWADIMKPFVKGKDGSPDGIGLGLSIVCQVMDIHGGSIDLQQSPGGGATVTLVFPRQT